MNVARLRLWRLTNSSGSRLKVEGDEDFLLVMLRALLSSEYRLDYSKLTVEPIIR